MPFYNYFDMLVRLSWISVNSSSGVPTAGCDADGRGTADAARSRAAGAIGNLLSCNVYASSTNTTTVQARKIVCDRTFDRTSCTSILIAVDFHSIFSQTGTAKLDDACRYQPNLQYITTSVRRLRATTIV